MAILGGSYLQQRHVASMIGQVSIADGDSWGVILGGFLIDNGWGAVSIADGDSWGVIRNTRLA